MLCERISLSCVKVYWPLQMQDIINNSGKWVRAIPETQK